MNRLTATVQTLRARGEGAFMPFLVIGDPDLETAHRLVDALVEAGADLLEFGFPFSDPPADGPVIQAADHRALAAGVTPEKAFEFLAAVQARHDIPVALLIYYNLVLQYGVEAFYTRARACGVDAVLVADVPLEESRPCVEAARAADVAPVFIATPLTTDARMAALGDVADGYLYAVTRVGITGEQADVDAGLADALARYRAHSPLPLLAGFGISTPAHVRRVMDAGADGVICGSALVRRIARHLDRPDEMVTSIYEHAAAMKAATRPQEKTPC